MEPKVAILPGVYRHYKGGLYRVLHPRVINEGTEEVGVVYVSLTPHGENKEQHRLTWRRIFGKDGWLDPTADGQKRFTLIQEA